MDNSSIKDFILGVLILGLVTMTIAYALLTQKLDIINTATVASSYWNIHFDNPTPAISTGSAVVTNQPSLTGTNISNLKAEFTMPGDSIIYKFDIHNEGDIDAVLSDFKINTSDDGIFCTSYDHNTSIRTCNNIIYSLTYTNTTTEEQTQYVIAAGTPVASNQQLKAGQSVNITLKIIFNPDANFVPGVDVKIGGLDAYFNYVQS